ncbi:hypothetical protein VQ643_01740 [Pseudomonas sp. F1_0610]|uniref:PilW family protein n=1 Tax=Pseudomonas sp. F1_0610 TaxID=3114284 RepID=UPI0039C061F8
MKYHAKGLSLIEIMVSLTVSLFLIMAVTHIYLKNKQSYIFESSIAQLQDSADFAQLVLEDWVYKAGFRRGVDVSLEKAFPEKKYSKDDNSCSFIEGSAVAELKGKVGFCVRYQPASDSEIDCVGNKVSFDKSKEVFMSTDPSYLVVLAFEHVKEANKNNGKLYCTNLSSNAPSTKVELLDHIADMHIEFGWSGNAGDEINRKVRRFGSSGEWGGENRKAYAIRYNILLSSENNKAQSKSSGVLNEWGKIKNAGSIINNDKKQLYKIVSSTLVLKGVTP